MVGAAMLPKIRPWKVDVGSAPRSRIAREHSARTAARARLPPLAHLIGDLFLIKSDHFLDGANTLFEILPHREQFVNHDRRTRESL